MAVVTPARYYTTKAQALGSGVGPLQFAAGKGYYLGDPYSSIIAGMPKPLTGAQVTSEANAEISPLVAAVEKQIEGQTAAATNAIKGYSADAAAKLAGLDYQAPYTQSESGQAAVDDALRQALAGAGTSDADALSSRLAVINDPSVAAAAKQVADNGAANGTTALASGSAALSNLLANAAAAGSYGNKLPGLAQLAGLQDIAAAQQQGQSNIGTQTQQLESQLPSIIQNLQSENDSRSSALASARENQVARQDAIASTAANNATKLAQTQTSAAAGVQKAKIAANTKATQASRPNASLSKTVGYVVDSNGNWIPGANGKPQLLPGYTVNAQGHVVKAGKTATGTAAGLTPGEAQTYLKTISHTSTHKDATSGQYVTSTTHTTNYQTAYKYLRSRGVDDQQARELLNSSYKKGQDGRAWLTNEEQSAFSQYNQTKGKAIKGHPTGGFGPVQPTPGMYNGQAFLTGRQLEVLNAYGVAPKVERGAINGNTVFWIDPNG